MRVMQAVHFFAAPRRRMRAEDSLLYTDRASRHAEIDTVGETHGIAEQVCFDVCGLSLICHRVAGLCPDSRVDAVTWRVAMPSQQSPKSEENGRGGTKPPGTCFLTDAGSQHPPFRRRFSIPVGIEHAIWKRAEDRSRLPCSRCRAIVQANKHFASQASTSAAWCTSSGETLRTVCTVHSSSALPSIRTRAYSTREGRDPPT